MIASGAQDWLLGAKTVSGVCAPSERGNVTVCWANDPGTRVSVAMNNKETK